MLLDLRRSRRELNAKGVTDRSPIDASLAERHSSELRLRDGLRHDRAGR